MNKDFCIENHVLSGYEGKETIVHIPRNVKEIDSCCFFLSHAVREVELPQGLEVIGSFAFEDSGLYDIQIPDSVKRIGDGAFHYCIQLLSARLSDSIKELPNDLFRDCFHLILVQLPRGLTSIGYKCFDSCRDLSAIDLPQGLQEIGPMAFCGCGSLASLTLPDSLETVGSFAFAGCTNLGEITIENPGLKLAPSAFDGCPNAWMTWPRNFPNRQIRRNSLVNFCSSMVRSEPVPPEQVHAYKAWISRMSVDQLLPMAAQYLPVLTYLIREKRIRPASLPLYLDVITHPGARAALLAYRDEILSPQELQDQESRLRRFAATGTLSEAEAKTMYTWRELEDHTLEILRYRGGGGRKLVLPGQIGGKEVTALGPGAFAVRSGISGAARLAREAITSVTVPASVRRMGKGCFENCSSLSYIRLSPGISSIPQRAFQGCHSLEALALDHISAIEANAFSGCCSLLELTLSDQVLLEPGSLNGTCDVVIHAPAGSITERYAILEGLRFEPI